MENQTAKNLTERPNKSKTEGLKMTKYYIYSVNFHWINSSPQRTGLLWVDLKPSCHYCVIRKVGKTGVTDLVIWTNSVLRFSIDSVLRSKIRSFGFLVIPSSGFGLPYQLAQTVCVIGPLKIGSSTCSKKPLYTAIAIIACSDLFVARSVT